MERKNRTVRFFRMGHEVARFVIGFQIVLALTIVYMARVDADRMFTELPQLPRVLAQPSILIGFFGAPFFPLILTLFPGVRHRMRVVIASALCSGFTLWAILPLFG